MAVRFQHTLTAVSGTLPIATVANANVTAYWPPMGQSWISTAYPYGLTSSAGQPQQDPAITSMMANYLDVRTVACSARIQCTQAALNAQGFIHLACVPEDMQGSTIASWSYPSSFSAMERAPFYQKVPLASLINNSATIALPIMDEGAWRYRNCNLLPSAVGSNFLQVNSTASTLPVQVTQTGLNSNSTGQFTITFAYAFSTAPVVVANYVGQYTGDVTIEVANITATGFTAQAVFDAGGSSAAVISATGFDWEATGSMTPANAALYYASVGQEVPAQISNYTSATIPGIETSYGWGALIIAMENVGTGDKYSPIEVEVIRHYEAIPNDAVGNVITGSKAAPSCPEVLQLNKAVQGEAGPVAILPDAGLDTGNERGFVSTVQSCAQWVSGVSGALSAFHPALSVVSAVSGAIAGVNHVYLKL